MPAIRRWPWLLLAALGWGVAVCGAAPWTRSTPAAEGLDAAALEGLAARAGGHGVVIRHGRWVRAWGQPERRMDVASAMKPVLAHLLFDALASGRVPSLEHPVVTLEPRLATLNPDLGAKDARITWRHLATQTACYGLREAPGTAFAYNDWQMALFADLLIGRVHGVSWAEADAQVLHPRLTAPLGCEDQPTLLAFGEGDRPGRLAISPRDFARFGQLYLQQGRWEGRELLPAHLARLAVASPLDPRLPRAGQGAASLLPGARTLGSRGIPDNQADHDGAYSFLWWVNGRDAAGRRRWAALPGDAFAALGHGGRRALWIIPSWDLVVSWNDARVASVSEENEWMGGLARAVLEPLPTSPASAEAAERTSKEAAPGLDLDVLGAGSGPHSASERRRVLIETDAGGDPDDEQSLVRFLLYANEWDVEGIVANRRTAREGENRNPERTGPGIVRRLVEAYAACWPRLVEHDPRYPAPEFLRTRVIPGLDGDDTAVEWILKCVDAPDPRPVWYSDWGSDRGSSTNNLRRALDRVLRERGPDGYARFKSRLRLVSADAFGPHTFEIEPAFPLWVDTWRPEREGRRWYHRFSALTARAAGFDLVRDVLTGHGPLGALYPTNTGLAQKEGDSLSFLYLVPNGLNEPSRPDWGGWGGRLGLQPAGGGRPYFWASEEDAWQGGPHRDHTLARWAADLQRDFQARLDWCVQPRPAANHPPALEGPALVLLEARPGTVVEWEARGISDPDGAVASVEWIHYPEAGTHRGPVTWEASGRSVRVEVPSVDREATIHFILRVTDAGEPPLSRYRRYVVRVRPPLQR